jgi:hypothetical protein
MLVEFWKSPFLPPCITTTTRLIGASGKVSTLARRRPLTELIYRMWTDVDMRPATLRDNTVCKRETSGGFWPTPIGETVTCSLGFPGAALDDYRLAGERGVDWAPAEQHYGP